MDTEYYRFKSSSGVILEADLIFRSVYVKHPKMRNCVLMMMVQVQDGAWERLDFWDRQAHTSYGTNAKDYVTKEMAKEIVESIKESHWTDLIPVLLS